MSRIIKKISKRTLFSIASVIGFLAVSMARIFFGSSDINTQDLRDQEKNMLNGCCDLPSAANADVPITPPTSCSSGGDGGGGDY